VLAWIGQSKVIAIRDVFLAEGGGGALGCGFLPRGFLLYLSCRDWLQVFDKTARIINMMKVNGENILVRSLLATDRLFVSFLFLVVGPWGTLKLAANQVCFCNFFFDDHGLFAWTVAFCRPEGLRRVACHGGKQRDLYLAAPGAGLTSGWGLAGLRADGDHVFAWGGGMIIGSDATAPWCGQ